MIINKIESITNIKNKKINIPVHNFPLIDITLENQLPNQVILPVIQKRKVNLIKAKAIETLKLK